MRLMYANRCRQSRCDGVSARIIPSQITIMDTFFLGRVRPRIVEADVMGSPPGSYHHKK